MDRRQFIQVAGVGSLAMMLTPLAQAADAAAATQARLADHVSEKELTRIVWGSCCHQDKPQPIWDPLNDFKPDLFIMLGDNIYADTTDMTVMAHKYQMLGNQPGFKRVRAHCPVVAIWDDHDYGVNDEESIQANHAGFFRGTGRFTSTGAGGELCFISIRTSRPTSAGDPARQPLFSFSH
jgi:phosphodiesterase/alkaline phosphatase D-like protein